MREAFDHCPTSRIRQSRKGCIQPIHNHMVVDILRVSSTHFAKNRPALLEIDSVTISRHGSRTCLSGPVEPQPDLPWRSRQSAMYSLTASRPQALPPWAALLLPAMFRKSSRRNVFASRSLSCRMQAMIRGRRRRRGVWSIPKSSRSTLPHWTIPTPVATSSAFSNCNTHGLCICSNSLG